MPWSGGVYTRWNAANVPPYWVGDASVGIKIEASRHDTQDQDFESGINACLAKDGSNSMSGNLDVNTNKVINLGVGTLRTDAATLGQLQDRTSSYLGTTGGTPTAFTVTATPTITALTTGAQYVFKANAANGAAATLKIDGTAATTMQRQGTALAGNEFKANDMVSVVYDGTNFQITNIATAPLFVDRTNNRVGVGTTAPSVDFDVQGTATQESIARFSADANGSQLLLRKSRGAAVGTNTIVSSGDQIGSIVFQGANGTGYDSAASISAAVDATPGASNDMPGNLTFSTTVDGSATLTERMRITNAGNIGIGTANPSSLLDVQSTNTIVNTTNFAATAVSSELIFRKSRGATVGTNTIVSSGDNLGILRFSGANGTGYTEAAYIVCRVDGTPGATNDMPGLLAFYTTADGSGSPTERVTITNNGLVIIKSDVSNTDGTGLDQGQLYIHDSDTSGSGLLLGYRYQSGVAEYARIQVRNGNNLIIQGGGGKVLINTTTIRNTAIQSLDFSASAGNAGYGSNDTSSTNAAVFHAFMTGGTYRGGITNNNNTAVAYNTTSDYRLKDEVSSMSGGLAKVKLLRPRTWKWKETGAPGQGFIAHELQEIIPDAVTGEKDAVYPDDSPKYQGVDLSFVVATLTNAIQELNAKVDALEARVAALEA